MFDVFGRGPTLDELADYQERMARSSGWTTIRCNCPESGTSGSCPFHDPSTIAPLDPDPRYVPEIDHAAVAEWSIQQLKRRWHAEPVRAAHHRRVGFLFGLTFGLILGALAVRAVYAATPRHASEPRWVPVHVEAPPENPEEGGRGANDRAPSERSAGGASTILDPFPVSPPPERAAVEVPAAELVVREKAAPRPAKGGSVAAARSYALSALGSAQFACFDVLMVRESNWNPRAYNASSGAYGIPQAVPGSKMAAYGADWRTNPVTQVRWGIAYVASRYGTACAALSHSYAVGWY